MPELSQLKGLEEDGSVPETRLSDEFEIANLVTTLVNNDEKRSKTRSMVKGLFDGNPPYNAAALRRAGQAYRDNTNWRIAEAFLTTALTQYWDVVSEAPTMATCVTDEGEPDQRVEWSNIITEEFQNFNLSDSCLNYMFQTSQFHMVLNGIGPVVWDDPLDYRARAVPNILLPDGERSDLRDWEVAVVITEYTMDKLYGWIRRESAATSVGWYVQNVKDILVKAVPNRLWPNGRYNRWDWLQQKLRNNDLAYGQICNKIQVAHVYYREFPEGSDTEGKISHCIIEADTKGPQYLFKKLKRYDNWRQVICPFYYDGGDGTHHSVKGLGIKSYGALESVNRLQCSLVDQANFAGSVHIQSQTENIRQDASIVEMGPYKVWPSQFNIITNMQSGQMLQGPMEVKQDLINTVTSNLSQYRQGLGRQKGNPISATEASWRAENETTLSRTQLTRYFDQLDEFWEERYRRVASPKATAKECKAFQKACKDRGVPAAALTNIRSVRATRTVGYGSSYNRQQALSRMMQVVTMLPDTGRVKLLEDMTSSLVGQSLMRRYLPESNDMMNNDAVIATLQVAAAKHNIPPVMPKDVNNSIFAVTFIQACEQVAGSLQQGANPMQVLQFLEVMGPAIFAHINEVKKDPTKKAEAKQLEDKAKELAKFTDQLRQKVQQMMEQQQEQQQQMQQAQAIQQGVDPNVQIKAAETQKKLQMSEAKTAHQLRLRQEKHNQDMAMKREDWAQKRMEEATEPAAE